MASPLFIGINFSSRVGGRHISIVLQMITLNFIINRRCLQMNAPPPPTLNMPDEGGEGKRAAPSHWKCTCLRNKNCLHTQRV